MNRRLLLVTGSRSLARTAADADWAQMTLARTIAALGLDGCVLQGGAVGPDAWARALAPWAITYRPDGLRIDSRGKPRRWGPDGDPLARNRAMVEAARQARLAGWEVAVHGLVDAGSPTGGTAYTLRLAEDVGLYTIRRRLDGEQVHTMTTGENLHRVRRAS